MGQWLPETGLLCGMSSVRPIGRIDVLLTFLGLRKDTNHLCSCFWTDGRASRSFRTACDYSGCCYDLPKQNPLAGNVLPCPQHKSHSCETLHTESSRGTRVLSVGKFLCWSLVLVRRLLHSQISEHPLSFFQNLYLGCMRHPRHCYLPYELYFLLSRSACQVYHSLTLSAVEWPYL